jgi:hypothetical protein
MGGFQANVTITNLGDRIDGWTLAWTFPTGQKTTQSWNATKVALIGRPSDRANGRTGSSQVHQPQDIRLLYR